jgi:FAD/FMN-containing dehydrogenase
MTSVSLRSTAGVDVAVDSTAIAQLGASIRGRIVTPTDTDYDAVRAIWNAMIDRRPGIIVRAAGTADVIQTVNFAREHKLLLSIRGGGHNIAGNAVCDGGVMLDLSLMKSVRVDPERRIVRVEPGCTLRDVDHEAQAFGLAVPAGINSTTGIAGLTLGGGFGWLARKHGLTIDNLKSADVVTADGKLLHASDSENADLFWAIRGGGGNFGVVTSFEFQAHPVGPIVLSGLIVHPFSDAAAVLKFYREFAAKAPDELVPWVVMRKAPPLPFLPPSVHGKEVVVLAVFYAGDLKAGERALEPLRKFGRPIADVVGPTPFAGWQQAFDPLLTPGVRNYWKSHNFERLDDGYLDTVVSFAGKLPSPHCEIFIGQLGAAASRVRPDAMAYSMRNAEFVMNVHGRWETAAEDKAGIAWARELTAATAKYATGGVYVNFMTADEEERLRASYGPNYDRLLQIKQKYDPQNLFRMNHNIAPVASV